MMLKYRLVVFSFMVVSLCASAQDYVWSSARMDGSRTGCSFVAGPDIKSAIGQILDDGTYQAPNGTIHNSESSLAAVAAAVIAVQPEMADVKSVVGRSEEEMPLLKQESKLSNWFVGLVMDKVAELSGQKVDVGICNFGGVRISMPKGDVILDDLYSMFPFKNNVVYLEHKGSELRKIFEKMAATRFQIVGGVEIVAENGRLALAKIGGEPIDDERIYRVASISFLLYGGDNLTLADNAVSMTVYDVEIIDAVMEHVTELTRQGKPITAPDVRYVTIR